MRDIVGAKGGTASGAPTPSCPDGPSSLPCGRKMPDQVGHDGGGLDFAGGEGPVANGVAVLVAEELKGFPAVFD